MTEKELLDTACEQFLGKSVNHICQVILQTLEGHLRAILGTLASHVHNGNLHANVHVNPKSAYV